MSSPGHRKGKGEGVELKKGATGGSRLPLTDIGEQNCCTRERGRERERERERE